MYLSDTPDYSFLKEKNFFGVMIEGNTHVIGSYLRCVS